MFKTTKKKIQAQQSATISFFISLILIIFISMGAIIFLQRWVIKLQTAKFVKYQEKTILNYQKLERKIDSLQEQVNILLERGY